jgi:hypothetical protein
MAETDSIQSPAPFSTWIGVVLLFVLFGLIVVAIIGPSPRGNTYEESRAKARMEKLQKEREENAQTLTTYAWIDKNKGTVRLPIDRAMQLTVTELAGKKPMPANPIAAPEAAAPGGVAAASPAPSPSPQGSGTPKPVSVSGAKSEARGQPTGAINPPAVQPGTQPGASASPAASPQSSAAVPGTSPSPARSPAAAGSPLPVRGATPSPSP